MTFWLGFDCNHAFDLAPAMEMRERLAGFSPLGEPSVYRTVAYVKEQCALLAAQAAEAATG